MRQAQLHGFEQLCAKPKPSPNGGRTAEREKLHDRFAEKLQVEPQLSRQLVSYQGNRAMPGLRWFKYKEGFSQALVERFLDEHDVGSLLDPFSGSGTAPLVAAGRKIHACGIDVSPVGTLAARAIAWAANGVSKKTFAMHGDKLMAAVTQGRKAAAKYRFAHVPITEKAFSEETEQKLGKVRRYIATVEDARIASMLNAACMSVLEDISYTRKDGQYLRWDERSGRSLKAKMNKGKVVGLDEALERKLADMVEDFSPLKKAFGGTLPKFVMGSSLEVMRDIKTASIDMVVTSPPYANRYDYTRTYALELAWLGYDREAFSKLRQAMISATVENKPKDEWLRSRYGGDETIAHAQAMYARQKALQEALAILRERQAELGNPHVLRLLEGYFREMALVVAELGRIVRPGGHVVMVNDNVQYHGEEIPVDLIFADYAESSGFHCECIEVLPRGKGNASQQMGRFGRRELRKCVYRWEKVDG